VDGGRRLSGAPRTAEPLVSIITVLYRAHDKLLELRDNILPLLDDHTEWIVIDGGSTDGTPELLTAMGDSIDYWVSEPDAGIYDAMNKGLSVAKGQYVIHINGGDSLRFIPHQMLASCLADSVDVACFQVDVNGWGIYRRRSVRMLTFTNIIHHQGAFYRRASHCGYDTRYRVFSDFDCNQKMLKAGKKIRMFEDIVADHFELGISSSRSVKSEFYAVIKSNYGAAFVTIGFFWESLAAAKRFLNRIR